jgi:hypothetical protein
MKTLVIASVLIAASSSAFAQTASRSGNAVIYGGQYLGSDPDPNVRSSLQREAPFRNGGS